MLNNEEEEVPQGNMLGPNLYWICEYGILAMQDDIVASFPELTLLMGFEKNPVILRD